VADPFSIRYHDCIRPKPLLDVLAKNGKVYNKISIEKNIENTVQYIMLQ
jgi:hypothetical protein